MVSLEETSEAFIPTGTPGSSWGLNRAAHLLLQLWLMKEVQPRLSNLLADSLPAD